MTAPANEIDALKGTIKKLEGERDDLKSQHDDETDQEKQTVIKEDLRSLRQEITAARNTLNLLIAAEQQGKFPLSFSFLFFPRSYSFSNLTNLL